MPARYYHHSEIFKLVVILPGEDDHFGFLVQENGRVVGLGGTGLEFGGQDEASLVVGDIIVALLDEGVDGNSQVDFFLYFTK
jgi:hypothetical protein